MSKRNIAYIKPQDPKFLQKLKQQIGYKEGPTVETKRQKLEDLETETYNKEDTDREDEKPQIVVINSGDLTAEEVAIEEKRLAKEVAEAPADLTKPIVFRKRNKSDDDLNSGTTLFSARNEKTVAKNKQNNSKPKPSSKVTVKLSFNADEEEEDQ